jgi:predicted tellurium resistance membrane protein TerC
VKCIDGLFFVEFIISLRISIVTDLILDGENAIEIGLAARKLPKEQQKK